LSNKVTSGLTKDGVIVANSELTPDELAKTLSIRDAHVYTVNARRIALDVLGRPIFNTAMLGALIRVAPLTSFESISKAVKARFSGTLGEKNVEAMKRAYEEVVGK